MHDKRHTTGSLRPLVPGAVWAIATLLAACSTGSLGGGMKGGDQDEDACPTGDCSDSPTIGGDQDEDACPTDDCSDSATDDGDQDEDVCPSGDCSDAATCGVDDGVCPDGCAGQDDPDCVYPACAEGPVTTACICGGITVLDGHCCSGVARAAPCSVAECAQGAVTATCSCGGTTVSDGYCCSGVAGTNPCSLSACAEGAVAASCNCGGTTVSSGYCCSGDHQTDPCGYVADYYVATDGDDDGLGTIDDPYATLSKAWTVVEPGDLIYVRGGTYELHGQLVLTGKSGSSGNRIRVWAYPGELPIFTAADDFAWSGGEELTSGIYFSGNYVHFKRLDIAYMKRVSDDVLGRGMMITDSSNNIIEQCRFHHNEGAGLHLASSGSTLMDNNVILNCDFYYNYQPARPGDTDGIDCGGYTANPSGTNYLTGCRAWSNSDDGIDTHGANNHWIFKDCWSFRNGFIPGTTTPIGDGNGYKGGYTSDSYYPEVKREYYNCLAFDNKRYGWSQEETDGKFIFYNNTGYHNGLGAGGWSFVLHEFGEAQTFRNNIAYADATGPFYWGSTPIDHDDEYNSWNGSVTLSNDDFVSLDSTGMDGPRQSDGSLPVTDFLRLSSGSDLINAGVDVGLPYLGTKPDLGAFEKQ